MTGFSTLSRRLLCVPLCMVLASCTTLSTSPEGDPYFMKTRTEATVYIAPEDAVLSRVVVLPFAAEDEGVGVSLSDLFETELRHTERYSIVERSEVERVLGAESLRERGSTQTRAIEAAVLLEADAVVIGRIDAFSLQERDGRAEPVIGISAKLIEVTKGKVAWSVDRASRSSKKGDTLAEHSRVVVHEVVAGLYQHWIHFRKPIEPAGFAVSTGGIREAVVTWAEPRDRGSDIVVERSLEPLGPFERVARVAGVKERYVDQGNDDQPLFDNTVYYYRLLTKGANGVISDPTVPRQSLTAPQPGAPRLASARSSAARSIALVWTAPIDRGLSRYEVERTEVSNPDGFKRIGTTEGTVYVDQGNKEFPMKDGTAYLYRIRARNTAGVKGVYSALLKVSSPPAPSAVRDLVTVPGGLRSVLVSWSVAAELDVMGYRLERSTDEGKTFEDQAYIKGRMKTRYRDGGDEPGSLKDNALYIYRLVAVNAVGAESTMAAEVWGQTRARPPIVAEVKVSVGLARRCAVTWQVSKDVKVTGYHLYRKTLADKDAGFEKVATVEGRDVATYVDKGKRGLGLRDLKHLTGSDPNEDGEAWLSSGTEYQYQVLAFNAVIEGETRSVVVGGVTKSVPAAPGDLAVKNGDKAGTHVSWTKSPSKEVESYRVQRSTRGEKSFRDLSVVEGDTGLEYADLEAKRGATILYRVAATDSDGLQSAWTESVSVTVPE